MELEWPAPQFLQLLPHVDWCPLPRHVVDAYGDNWTSVDNLVVNGPFRVANFTPGDRLVLIRNPTYGGHFSGNVDRIEFILDRPWEEVFELYKEGELDVIAANLPRIQELALQYPGEFVSAPTLQTALLSFNTNRAPFDDKRVRQALAMALDREGYAARLGPQAARPARGGWIPPGMPGFQPGINLPFDLNKARRLLSEAGYPEGTGFPEVTCIDGQLAAEWLQESWKVNLGIEMKFEAVDTEEYFQRLSDGFDAHIILHSLAAVYPDPEMWLGIDFRPFRAPWEETVRQMQERARSSSDPEQRLERFKEIDRFFVENAIFLPILHLRQSGLIKPWVKRLPVSSSFMSIYSFQDAVITPH